MSPYIHSQGLNFYAQFLEVRRRLAEVSASFWVDLELYNWLNQAQQDIAMKARCLKKAVTVTTTSGTQEYDLKTSTNAFQDIIDISEDGVSFKIGGTSWDNLKYTTKAKLNIDQPNWRSASSGTPMNYYYDKASKTIGLYPKPNASNAGAYLLIEGIYMPRILNAGLASAGDATTLTLATGSATQPYGSTVDDYYNGLYMELYSGIGIGERALITDYVGSTKVCTVNFTTTPTTASYYGMVSELPETAHNLMVTYALGKCWMKGGIRTQLGMAHMQQYYQELNQFIDAYNESDDESIIREAYRS